MMDWYTVELIMSVEGLTIAINLTRFGNTSFPLNFLLFNKQEATLKVGYHLQFVLLYRDDPQLQRLFTQQFHLYTS